MEDEEKEDLWTTSRPSNNQDPYELSFFLSKIGDPPSQIGGGGRTLRHCMLTTIISYLYISGVKNMIRMRQSNGQDQTIFKMLNGFKSY